MTVSAGNPAHDGAAAGESNDVPIATAFAALANSDRLAILRALAASREPRDRGLSISEVAAAVGLTRFSASRHLRILDEANLVTATHRRRALHHCVNPAGFERVEDWIWGITPQ